MSESSKIEVTGNPFFSQDVATSDPAIAKVIGLEIVFLGQTGFSKGGPEPLQSVGMNLKVQLSFLVATDMDNPAVPEFDEVLSC